MAMNANSILSYVRAMGKLPRKAMADAQKYVHIITRVLVSVVDMEKDVYRISHVVLTLVNQEYVHTDSAYRLLVMPGHVKKDKDVLRFAKTHVSTLVKSVDIAIINPMNQGIYAH